MKILHLNFMFFINGFLCLLVRNSFEMENVLKKFKMGRKTNGNVLNGNDVTIG